MGLLERVGKKIINDSGAPQEKSGRIAVYDLPTAPPRMVPVAAASWSGLIEKMTTQTYRECQNKGVSFPYVVLREVIENLIHASFKEIVVSILDEGQTIRVTDQGPGIEDKRRAFEPGFTTATSLMKDYIRGVGSGLPVVKEIMTFSGGHIEIRDNLGTGTVVTLLLKNKRDEQESISLTRRQVTILSLITELEAAGPSYVSKELGLSLSTVHRDLICLEDLGLLKSSGQGKRFCTAKGIGHLNKTATERL